MAARHTYNRINTVKAVALKGFGLGYHTCMEADHFTEQWTIKKNRYKPPNLKSSEAFLIEVHMVGIEDVIEDILDAKYKYIGWKQSIDGGIIHMYQDEKGNIIYEENEV